MQRMRPLGAGGLKALVLGGSGQFGSGIARFLAASEVVSHIGLAGRNQSSLARVASAVGDKAHTVSVDILDEPGLVSASADYDIMINAAGPDFKVTLPAIRSAIKSGTHYCDLSTDGPSAEKALSLNASAKAAGVTALTGIGIFPGLSNLMLMHAARQLDQPEELRNGIVYPIGEPDVRANLEAWRRSGVADASWQSIMTQFAGKVRVYQNGHWVDVDPLESAVRVVLPPIGEVSAVPIGQPQAVTFPHVLPQVRSVSTLATAFPPQLNELCCEISRRLARGEIDASAAAVAFHEQIAAEPNRWLAVPPGYEPTFMIWAEAIGTRQGRRVRYLCWPNGGWISTSVTLGTAALKLLRAEIKTRGVLSPESCVDPMPFFEDVARYAKEEDRGKPLLSESLEWLD